METITAQFGVRSARMMAAARPCWRSAATGGLVMFHSRYRHSFIAHAHEVATIIQLTDGAVDIEIDGVCHRVEPGPLVLIGANQVHSARPVSRSGWSMRSLHVPPGFFSLDETVGRDQTVRFRAPVLRDGSVDHAGFAEWHAACEAGVLAQAQDCRQRFAAWLRKQMDSFAPEFGSHCSVDERVAQARALLDEHLLERMALEDVAGRVGLSSHALICGFSRSYGLPPHTWRMQARVGVAAQMIDGGGSLAEVADCCGFSDQSHLARVFKRVFGVTPGAYRAMH